MITYRISPEYYNKNLFYTFGVLEIDTYPKEYTEKNAPSNPLFEISKIGVIGSSVYSLIYGLIIAFVNLIHKQNKRYLKISIKSCLIIILVSTIAGLIGYIYGSYFFVSEVNEMEYNKDNFIKVIDYKNFLTVNIIRSYSIIGSFLGLFIVIIYSIRQKTNKNFVQSKG